MIRLSAQAHYSKMRFSLIPKNAGIFKDAILNQRKVDSVNVFEQISQICRDFRKQISQGKPPRIERYLSSIAEDGRETLFSNLLEIEINFRQRKGEQPSTDEYLQRFPQFAKQVRRAFFEPTMASVDSGDSVDGCPASVGSGVF